MQTEATVWKFFLYVYNGIQFCGWSYILTVIVVYLLQHEPSHYIWEHMSGVLITFQYGASIEIMYSLIGIMRSPVFALTLQTAARVIVTALIHNCPKAQRNHLVIVFLVCWSITETVRYLYYALHQLQREPYFLKWLRYTLFIVLYPLGAFAEVSTLYYSIPYFNKITLLHFNIQGVEIKPEEWVQWYLYLYIIGFPYLYYHMLKQRNKHLKNKQD